MEQKDLTPMQHLWQTTILGTLGAIESAKSFLPDWLGGFKPRVKSEMD